jgi:hypothetical protein
MAAPEPAEIWDRETGRKLSQDLADLLDSAE